VKILNQKVIKTAKINFLLSSDGLGFSQLQSLTRRLKPLKNYGVMCNAIFFICTHAHKPLSREA